MERDLTRIENYYHELERENEHRRTRKGVTAEKLGEITAKTEAIVLERQKQLAEIKKKYSEHTEINLEHGIIYFIPMLRYQIERSFRARNEQQTLYYNLITRTFEKAAE